MGVKFGYKTLDVTVVHRREDSIVSFKRDLTLVWRVVVQRTVRLGGVPELTDQTESVGLVGIFEQTKVKPAVGREFSGDIARRCRRGTFAGGQTDSLKRVLIKLWERVTRGQFFQHGAQLVNLVQVGNVQLGDEVPTPRLVRDLALFLQHRQRLAYRCHADAERFRHLLLADAVAGAVSTSDNRRPKSIECVLASGPERRLRIDHGHRCRGYCHLVRLLLTSLGHFGH